MDYGAIDLHLRRSQVRIIDEREQVVLDRRIDTAREAFAAVFADRSRMRILIESSTDSEWVAQHLEGLGHEVVVVDPNYAAMYGARSRAIKTDRRDVAALALANRRGVYRAAHRVGAATRALRQQLRVRQQVIRQRTALINLVRAMLRQEGLRLPSGHADTVLARLARLSVPPALLAGLAPVRALLASLQTTLDALEATVVAHATTPATQRLMTVPGVGPIVALTYQATLDTPHRFGGSAARASAFVGLVPREDSSAERQRKGHITKTGPAEVRTVLVQASWVIWRSRSPRAAPLRTWAQALAARRGRRIAIVALARRVARLLYAMWRDGTGFQAPARRPCVAI